MSTRCMLQYYVCFFYSFIKYVLYQNNYKWEAVCCIKHTLD